MKMLARGFLGLICLTSLALAEDWKGPPDPGMGDFGAMIGMGIYHGSSGFTVIGTASKKIIPNGFIEGITNPISIEAELGPIFYTGLTSWFYSGHLRWDFVKDTNLTVFAIGGIGGNVVTVNSSTQFEVYPRLAVGALWKFNSLVYGRAEVSHELITAGLIIPF